MEKLFFTKEQKQILDIQKLYPDTGVCNVAGIINVENVTDYHIVTDTIKHTLEDIDILHLQMDEKYNPFICKEEIHVDKWDGNVEPDDKELSEWLMKPFDMCNHPLYEARYWVEEDQIKLYIRLHHIIMDGYSIAIAMNQFVREYTAILEGHEIPEKLSLDFVEQMKLEYHNTEADNIWFKELVPEAMEEGWKVKKTQNGNIQSERLMFQLSDDIYEELIQFEKKNHISSEVVIASALSIYLSDIYNSSKVSFGRSMANRGRKEMNMPGMKVNQLPAFVNIDENADFATLCKNVKSNFFDMMRHASASFSEYLTTNQIDNNYYDITISYRNERFIPMWGEVEQKEIYNGLLELPLRIFINELNNGLRLELQYQINNYSEREIEYIYNRLLHIIEAGISGKNISDISVLSDLDLDMWNNINRKSDIQVSTMLIPDSIKDSIHKYENKIAVSFRKTKLSYKELDDRSNTVAGYLIKNGIGAGAIVGVHMKVSEILPVIFLGIWKAGAAFLPIGINESEERVQDISNMCTYVFNAENAREVSSYTGFVTALPDITGDMIAYYMNTSGSSGKPKTVKISHASLAWRLNWMKQQYIETEDVLQKAAYTFDVSMWEFFLPLISGGTLYLLEDENRANPKAIADILQANKIKAVHFVPSVLGMFLNYIETHRIEFSCLKHVFSSGENLPPELAKQFYRVCPHGKLHNLYGPTECTIDVTYYDCNGYEEVMPIGRPVPGMMVSIVDSKGKCVPVGVEGDLIVSGILVGEGYYGCDSDNYFIDKKTGEKSYNTGDRAILGFDGLIYYLGRNDKQCKINGMRVDLNQIEDAMLQIEGIYRAAVVYHKNRLTGFYMSDRTIDNINEIIGYKLPVYSTPSECIWMMNIPLTANGKTDYKFLVKYLEKNVENNKIKLPETPLEKILVKYISQELRCHISIDENLFQAGLDSLKMMNVLVRLEEDGYSCKPEDFYTHKTIEKIASNSAGIVESLYWLNREHNKNVVVAFPYAAGTFHDYEAMAAALAEANIDFVVSYSGEQKLPLAEYEKVVFIGYCTGTVLAASAMEHNEVYNDKISGVILCAAIPPDKVLQTVGSPWKKLNDKGIIALIQYLHRQKITVTTEMIATFRKDTNRFFDYFNENHRIKCKNIVLCFGRQDILTKGAERKWKLWRKYINGPIRIRVFRKEHHFFIHQRQAELISEIMRVLK